MAASALVAAVGAHAAARRSANAMMLGVVVGRHVGHVRRKHVPSQQARGVRVLAIGNTIIDTVLTMERIPRDDKVWIESKQTFVGGQGANAAQGMARLGLNVSFLTRLGDDTEGRWAQASYEGEGMDTKHCIVVPKAQTMSACVTIGTACMTRCCFMHRDNALFAHDLEPHLREVDLSAFDVVYTDGHQTDLALPVARAAAAKGMPIVADIEVLDNGTRELFELATDVVAPANTIKELAEVPDPGTAALALANAGPPGKVVVATEGEVGSFGGRSGDLRPVHVPAQEGCKAFDTLGAGDAYHAGYVTALSRHGREADLEERMRFATTVAAALCETPGPVVSLASLARYGIVPLPRPAM